MSGAWALVVAVTIPVVLNHLHRLDAAHRSPQWLSFARSMGGAVTAVWLVTGAARGTLGHLVDTMNEPLPGVDVLRFSTGMNYTLLGQSGMAVLGCASWRSPSSSCEPEPSVAGSVTSAVACVSDHDRRRARPVRRLHHSPRDPVGAVPRSGDLAPAIRRRVVGTAISRCRSAVRRAQSAGLGSRIFSLESLPDSNRRYRLERAMPVRHIRAGQMRIWNLGGLAAVARIWHALPAPRPHNS